MSKVNIDYIPVDEQETTISISRDRDEAHIWTSDQTMITKLDKMVAINSGVYVVHDTTESEGGRVLVREYRMPKRLVSFRSPTKQSEAGRLQRLKNVEKINATYQR